MSISDTQSAKKYASIAEVAAAQAKMYALELENAPDYASEAQAAATSAAASSDTASQYASNAATAAASASSSANDAANSAAEAAAAAGVAINQTVRAPTGESLTALPAAASRINQFIVTGAAGDVEVMSRDSVPVLDSSGKLPVSVIPAIALTEPFVVNSEAAMLALDAQPGDIAKRTDLGYSFCLAASPASTLSNWVQLTDDVLAQLGLSSGATQVGATSLSGASSTVQAELNKKPDSTDLAASTGAAAIGATTDAGSTTTVQGALALKVAATTLSGTGAGQGANLVGYQYATDSALLTVQSRLAKNLFIDDFVQSADAGDYGIALNRIFTKYASSTGFTVNFGSGTYNFTTPSVYSGTATVTLKGSNETAFTFAGATAKTHISITTSGRIYLENIIGTVVAPSSGVKILFYLNATNLDASHYLNNIKLTTDVEASGSGVIMFDVVNPSLSSFSDVYVKYFGAYGAAISSNNIAWRLSAPTKVSTDSMFKNCDVLNAEIGFLCNFTDGTGTGFLEGLSWYGCTQVNVGIGVQFSGVTTSPYKSPMHRWYGGHIAAYRYAIFGSWVAGIVIDGTYFYCIYDATLSGSTTIFPIALNYAQDIRINNTGLTFVNAPSATLGNEGVHVGDGCNFVTITGVSYANALAGPVVRDVASANRTRAGNCVVLYSGTAPSVAVSFNGTNSLDMGNNTVYAQ